MDLPDCPPGAEGYEDSVVEVPKKPEIDDNSTKAEREFHEHLNSLKIKLEDGTTRCMVERRGRDISGKWIYLCYPCAAVCSGESILQTHISGKKHKIKLTMKTAWPKSIFDEHPFIQSTTSKAPVTATEKVLQKMATEVELHNRSSSEWESNFNKYRDAVCHIQDALNAVKAPILGAEYLIEHPPEQPHYEPTYVCTLCNKQGHPRTIINHMTCFWHRSHYLKRYFPKATELLTPYRNQNRYREAINLIIYRLAQRVEEKFGRTRPVHIDKDEYEANKDRIHQWINKMKHFSERDGPTFEEVVDFGLIESLDAEKKVARPMNRDPSPPIVAAPKPHFNQFSRPPGRQERRAGSVASLSDISDDEGSSRRREPPKTGFHPRDKSSRYEPYPRRGSPPARLRYVTPNAPRVNASPDKDKQARPKNYGYKVKLTEEKRQTIEDNLKKMLAYHEKNPEKHPLYPEEWKKFWNRRYKEIQTEGKDPSKHDFKPEWIVFWTARMKELYEDELRVQVDELYRRMRMSPPGDKPPEPRHRSPERRPEPRRRSPPPRRRSPEIRRDPGFGRPPSGRRSPVPRRRTPERLEPRRPPPARRSPPHSAQSDRRRSPPRRLRTRTRSRSPIPRRRSPARTNIELESSVHRSLSPLSQREALPARNRSPERARNPAPERAVAPALQTVLVSDDELRPSDDLSPWNSDNDIDSVGSLPEVRSRTASVVCSRWGPRHSLGMRGPPPQEYGAPENIVATLRSLVGVEDYLGSIGPKIVDLLSEALKMEKEKANSSEELLVRDSAVVMIETAKEKLKGAAQAGRVPGPVLTAVRAAIVRAAATLHEADNRTRAKQRETQATAASKPSAVPVAGVGEVDRAEIAKQMAEALIAQGKTDVSSEELAQLVDAVVGMAEAKKREADKLKAAVPERPKTKPTPIAPYSVSGTASALQMLQSAYDENEKKIDKEDAPDAMDGLSDSDLETLLKNFNELSAEEQHSLIAYLKKLEAKEPTRVERLRKYVSDAAAGAPKDEPKPAAAPVAPAVPTVHVDSDDDDYTVEEVFQSATQKVKEHQIRQELEIVKKSLEEHKVTPAPKPAAPDMPTVDLTQKLSSATDLFALVQASLKSTPAPTTPNVVVSGTQPRSFGDKPEVATTSMEPMAPITILNPARLVEQGAQQILPEPAQMNFDNVQNEPYNQGIDGYNQNNDIYNQGNDNFNQGNDNYNQGNDNYNQSNDNYNQGNEDYNRGTDYNQVPDNYSQPNVDYNQGTDNYYQGNDNYNQGNDNYNQGGNDNYNQGGNDNYNQGTESFNQPTDFYNQGSNNFNPGTRDFIQDNANFNQTPGNLNQGAWNPRLSLVDVRRPPTRGSNNFGQKQYNHNTRGNARGLNNDRTQNQQNNYRGRGGGRGNRGSGRGRGRGFY